MKSGQDPQNTIRGDVFITNVTTMVANRRETHWELHIIATNLVRDGQRSFRVQATLIGINPGAQFVTTDLGQLHDGSWTCDDTFPGVPTGDEHRLLEVQLVRRGGSQMHAQQRIEVEFWCTRDGVNGFDRSPDLVIKYDFRLS